MKKVKGILATLLFTVISIIFVSPIIVVLMNSFKKKTLSIWSLLKCRHQRILSDWRTLKRQ